MRLRALTFAASFVLLAQVCLLSGCREWIAPKFGDFPLSSFESSKKLRLKDCPSTKCLTVYVAPWCGICRDSTELILSLKAYFRQRGVTTRIVVGRATSAKLEDFAAKFGPGTVLDPTGKVNLYGGLPQFIVSAPGGTIYKVVSGVPGIFSPPHSQELLSSYAVKFGLR